MKVYRQDECYWNFLDHYIYDKKINLFPSVFNSILDLIVNNYYRGTIIHRIELE